MTPPPPAPLPRARKAALSVAGIALLAVNLAIGLQAHEVAAVEPLADALRPMKAGAGFGQFWHMFSNPPKWTTTISVEALSPVGSWEAVPPVSAPQPGPVRFRNWRGGKEEEFERKDDHAYLLGTRTKNLCRRRAEAGRPVLGVRFLVHKVRTVRPEHRVLGPPYPERETRDEVLGPYWCDR